MMKVEGKQKQQFFVLNPQKILRQKKWAVISQIMLYFLLPTLGFNWHGNPFFSSLWWWEVASSNTFFKLFVSNFFTGEPPPVITDGNFRRIKKYIDRSNRIIIIFALDIIGLRKWQNRRCSISKFDRYTSCQKRLEKSTKMARPEKPLCHGNFESHLNRHVRRLQLLHRQAFDTN